MYRTILVAVDGSERSRKAVKAAARMAAHSKARVHLLNVQPTVASLAVYADGLYTAYPADKFNASAEKKSRAILLAARKIADKHGAKSTMVSESSDDVAATIIRVAKKLRCDLILMASHGRGALADVILGSTTHRVLAKCKIPVLVHR